MKFIIDKNKFLNGISVVNKVIKDNKIRPVLSCIHIEADSHNNLVTLRGTDLEITIIKKINTEVEVSGVALVSHDFIVEYLKALKDEEIEFLTENNLMKINSSQSSSEFDLDNHENYPLLDIKALQNNIEINKNKFISYLEKTKFSASTSFENTNINCIRIEVKDNTIKVIASDSYRMICLSDHIDIQNNLEVSIPLETVEIIIKTLKSYKDENLCINYDSSQIVFKIEDTFIASRIVQDKFPDYKMIFNSMKYDKDVTVNRDNFLHLLKKTYIFSRNNSKISHGGIFDFLNDKLFIESSSETAKITDDITCKKIGDDIRVSLNIKFLIDYTLNIEKDTNIEIKLSNDKGAVLFSKSSDNNYNYLVMPLAYKTST